MPEENLHPLPPDLASLPIDRLPTPVVLGSGANAYGLVRSLARAGIRPILADDHRGPAFLSRLVAGRWRLPPLSAPALTARTLTARLAQVRGEVLVIPTNEPWVHLLNLLRDALGPRVHLPLAGPEVVEFTLRKSAMHRWCLRHEVAHPETLVFHPGQDWGEFMDRALERLPVIIKPDTKGLGDEALGFPTAEFISPNALRAWGEGFSPAGPPCAILAQRYLQAPGMRLTSWLGYRSPHGSLYMAGMTKLRCRPPRLGGCGAAWRFTAGPATRRAALRILEKLNYEGFFDLEFLVPPGEEPPLFIELNPRPGMPNYATTIMGLNLPLLALAHCLPGAPRTSRVLTDLPGIWLDLSCDPWLALSGRTVDGRRWSLKQWLQSLGPAPLVDAHLNWRDPLVFPAACARLSRLALRYFFRTPALKIEAGQVGLPAPCPPPPRAPRSG